MTKTISPEKIQELIDLPHGQAGKWVRENIDPMWGLSKGSKKGEISVSMDMAIKDEIDMDGTLIVDADTKEEAEAIANQLKEKWHLFKWDSDFCYDSPEDAEGSGYEIDNFDIKVTEVME